MIAANNLGGSRNGIWFFQHHVRQRDRQFVNGVGEDQVSKINDSNGHICLLIQTIDDDVVVVAVVMDDALSKCRYRRRYDDAVTPYDRVMTAATVPHEQKEKLRETHESLNPLVLKRQLEAKLRKFWKLYRRLKQQRDGNQKPLNQVA